MEYRAWEFWLLVQVTHSILRTNNTGTEFQLSTFLVMHAWALRVVVYFGRLL